MHLLTDARFSVLRGATASRNGLDSGGRMFSLRQDGICAAAGTCAVKGWISWKGTALANNKWGWRYVRVSTEGKLTSRGESPADVNHHQFPSEHLRLAIVLNFPTHSPLSPYVPTGKAGPDTAPSSSSPLGNIGPVEEQCRR